MDPDRVDPDRVDPDQVDPDQVDPDLLRAEPAPDRGWHVRANMVSSADGAGWFDGRSGPLSGPADVRHFRLLRAVCDVVLVGAGTVRAEDYGPVTLPEELRAWRRALAKENRLPPYIILHARHMASIAARCPTTLEALSQIKGIGPKRLERYGAALLEIIGAHLDSITQTKADT